MFHFPRSIPMRWRALALLVCVRGAPVELSCAHEAEWLEGPHSHVAAMPVSAELQSWDAGVAAQPPLLLAQATATDEVWIAPPSERSDWIDANIGPPDVGWDGLGASSDPCPPSLWHWQVLPDGLIYRSYQAGLHEPRLGIVAMDEAGSQAFWDGTLGGRVGLLRYGTQGAYFPQGWQLDVEAAALIRMTLDEIRDFETADYRVGVPVTYGIANWQFKIAGYHLSSHLGDELLIADPSLLTERINYVRDAIVLGASYYPNPVLRLYAEAAYAFNVDGGAEPWEFQFGAEVSRPGPTGIHGTPFWAVNGHLREEHNFGGDVSTQLGWLWRGRSGQVTRAGLHYFNGKSSQYQIFDDHEEQIGFGLWYDY